MRLVLLVPVSRSLVLNFGDSIITDTELSGGLNQFNVSAGKFIISITAKRRKIMKILFRAVEIDQKRWNIRPRLFTGQVNRKIIYHVMK